MSGARYKVAGRSDDGVRILEPKTKPTHFTSREMRSTVANVKRDSRTGRFVERGDPRSPEVGRKQG